MTKIIVSIPYKKAHTAEMLRSEFNLAVMQSLVDGNIEVVHPDGFPKDIVLICNDEGKLRGLDFNRFVMINGQRDVICGTCIICAVGIVDGEQDLIPLTEEQAKEILDALNG